MHIYACRFGGFCNDVDMFDTMLFRIAESEAIATDPQQRILLEETYACLQSANKLLAAHTEAACGKNS